MSICRRGSTTLVLVRRVALAMTITGFSMPIAGAATLRLKTR